MMTETERELLKELHQAIHDQRRKDTARAETLRTQMWRIIIAQRFEAAKERARKDIAA